jgi:hypothetical protein
MILPSRIYFFYELLQKMGVSEFIAQVQHHFDNRH